MDHEGTNNGTSIDYEPAYSTVDFVLTIGLRVESAHANNSTHTLLLLLRC